MIRGEIFEVHFPQGRRPGIVITRDAAIPLLTSCTFVPVTSRSRGITSEVSLGPDEGLARECVASCDNIHTIHRSDVGASVGRLGPGKLRDLDNAIRVALDLD